MSRFDLAGFFWEDEEATKKQVKERTRQIAPIPDTGWKCPRDFPNLFNEKILGLDLETYDPDLITHGPGWARGVGEIVGISLATIDKAWYFPIRHTMQPETNMDPVAVFKYLRDLLQLPMPKVGANIIYDTGWLQHEGVKTNGITYDIQYAEALLDDTAYSYSLETIATKYLGEGKLTEQLYDWCARSYGRKPKGKQRADIYRAPPCLVGPYAEGDALQPLQILLNQRKHLVDAGMWELFELECKLIPILQGMRFRGMPVNVEGAEKVESMLAENLKASQIELNNLAGFDVNVNIKPDLQRLFDKFGVAYPHTAKGNPSFTKKFLAANNSTAAKAVINIRKYEKIKTTFVRGAILDKHIEGKLYPSFHPLRGEFGGAVSGRFSSSRPNAQNIPARDSILAPMVRGIFIPEPGFDKWIKFDLSQIEYRIFAHVSQDKKLINSYQDPSVDYHAIVSGFLSDMLPRMIIKNFNFMSLFGGGKDKTIEMIAEALTTSQIQEMCTTFGFDYITDEQAIQLLGNKFVALYAEKFPAAKKTLQRLSNKAGRTGEIRTLLNRRGSFNQWEEDSRNKKSFSMSHEKACELFGGNIKRAGTYKALNRITQGGSADMLKKGMVNAYEAGLFNADKLGFPHVTVHDELDFSFNDDLRKEALELKYIMENAIKLKVPVIMDIETGTNWGSVTEIDWS